MKTEWTPKNIVIGVAFLIGLIFLSPKLEDALPAFVRFLQTTPTAYAAKAIAEKTQSDFDKYIESEKQNRALEQQRIDLQQEFNKQLLQQQQVPNAPAPRFKNRNRDLLQSIPFSGDPMNVPITIRVQDERGDWWCCATTTDECDYYQTWEPCP